MERRILVLYGSQTGTAQEVAERVGREAKRFLFNVQVSPLNDYQMKNLPTESLVVYVVSTTGQGEEPDNMKAFWRLLCRKSLPANSLSSQKYGVLGLGDSGYPKFNLVAKKLNRRLLQLGAMPLLSPGLGDDQHDFGPDFVVDAWLLELWDLVLQLCPIPDGATPISKNVLPAPKYNVIWDNTDCETDHKSPSNSTTNAPDKLVDGGKTVYTQSHPFGAKVLSCERVTPESHFQEVRVLQVDLADSGIEYDPGDVALLQPENLQENVDFFFSLFPTLDRNKKFLLESTDPCVPLPPESVLPRPCSVQQAVMSYFDVQSIPRRYFFELLSHFTTDPLEKEKFIEFNTAEGQQDLYEYCNKPRRHILEVLYDFRHTTPNIPFEYLFDLIPQIKPRSFSIASSVQKHKNALELLVAVVKYRSNMKTPRLGLCSNWVSRLKPGSEVRLWTRKGTLRFPSEGSTPCVMVGPGTGVAPFRSYISSVGGKSARSLLLFFGCRNQRADFFFADEWATYDTDAVRVFAAFSRDQPDKVYVQHVMAQHAEDLCQAVLDAGGMFYVAGNSKLMPTQVRQALVDALATRLDIEGRTDEAEKYVATMEAKGRYQTETWS